MYEELVEKLRHRGILYNGISIFDDAADAIETLESELNRVPVVRCKDCMFRCEPIEFGELYCPVLNGSMNNDDFCSYGERKESNE